MYLGGKKTEGDLWESVAAIEAAINNQVRTIRVETNRKRDTIPLALDKKVFRPCIGVISWTALEKVQLHWDKTGKPTKPCTGVFTRTMGLPCAHIFEKRMSGDLSTGILPQDFHPFWFWDRSDPRAPILEPLTIRRRKTNTSTPTNRNTGRILSTFERVSQSSSTPRCSACHQLGHRMTSNACSLKQQQRERTQQSLNQASQLTESTLIPSRLQDVHFPTIVSSNPSSQSDTLVETCTTSQATTSSPSLSQRIANTSVGSAITSFASRLLAITRVSGENPISEHSTSRNSPEKHKNQSVLVETPFNGSESRATVIEKQSHIENTCSQSILAKNNLNDLPQQAFQVPRGLSLVRDMPPCEAQDIDVSRFDSLFEPLPPSTPAQRPPQVAQPLPSLRHDRPEMVFLRYKEKKERWLASHPRVAAKNYRKYVKLPTYSKYILQTERRKLPWERRDPSGQLIAERANWTDEEVLACIDYEKELEEEEYRRQTRLVHTEGFAVIGCLREVWERKTAGSTEGYIYAN